MQVKPRLDMSFSSLKLCDPMRMGLPANSHYAVLPMQARSAKVNAPRVATARASRTDFLFSLLVFPRCLSPPHPQIAPFFQKFIGTLLAFLPVHVQPFALGHLHAVDHGTCRRPWREAKSSFSVNQQVP